MVILILVVKDTWLKVTWARRTSFVSHRCCLDTDGPVACWWFRSEEAALLLRSWSYDSCHQIPSPQEVKGFPSLSVCHSFFLCLGNNNFPGRVSIQLMSPHTPPECTLETELKAVKGFLGFVHTNYDLSSKERRESLPFLCTLHLNMRGQIPGKGMVVEPI